MSKWAQPLLLCRWGLRGFSGCGFLVSLVGFLIVDEINPVYNVNQALFGCISAIFGSFGYLRAHFLEVEGNGEEGKVHRDLVFAEVAETLVCHVCFHLPEDGLWFDASSAAVLDAFFGCEQLAGLFLVTVQPVVDLDGAAAGF